jgi:malate permease and related proteins
MFTAILFNVVGPIVVLIGIGALLRWKFELDMTTLSKLNIYFTVPGFIFYKVATSTLGFADMGGIVTVTVAQMATLGVLVYGFGTMFGVNPKTLSAIALAVIFYNSGNYGLPLADLAYPTLTPGQAHSGAAVQSFVLMTQNLLTFTAGLVIASAAQHGFKWSALRKVFRLPMLPALGLGILAKLWIGSGHQMPIIVMKPAQYVAEALVPLALLTLGAQLASQPRWPRWKPVGVVMLIRLGFGPIQMGLILWTFHWLGWGPMDLWNADGWPAQLLILTAAVPTAVNTLLLTLELDGDVALAADCVFWTTIVSCVSIPVWLYVIWWFFGVG